MQLYLPTLPPTADVSRRNTTLIKSQYLVQLPMLTAGRSIGTRAWTHEALRVRIAESAADRGLYASIVRRFHYLGRWPVPPKTKILAYLADLDGVVPGPAGAAAMMMVALLPGNFHVLPLLKNAGHPVHRCEVLTLVRSWRADDLGPEIAPDLTPEVLRRVVRGERHQPHCPLSSGHDMQMKRSVLPWLPDWCMCGPRLPGLREAWTALKCDDRLRARPRLLVSYADPSVGHDGALYRSAGAACCGLAPSSGKLLFAWALDPGLRGPLMEIAQRGGAA